MSSLLIAEITGKNHKELLRSIRKMEDSWFNVCGRRFALTSREVEMPNGGARTEVCYELTKVECLYIATKFNDEARAKLVLRWKELEEDNAKKNAIPSKDVVDSKFTAIKWVKELNRPSEASLARMSNSVLDLVEVPRIDYVPCVDIQMSATELLKKYGSPMSIQIFNKKAIERGILEEKSRKSKNGTKKYKCLTEKGLEYGTNQISPYNELETQPHYYESKFQNLLNLLVA